jgi:hypothetical protein
MPEDIRWMLELTGPRIESFCQYYYRKIGLDSKTLQKSNALLAKTLPGKQCTRAELKQTFEAANIDTSGLRLGFLVMHAELSALICSGALRGKQHTYTLLEERAPKARSLPRDEALAELTKRYFTSHGPAQVQDFAWWSGLTVGDAKKGLDIVTPELLHETVDGKAFWFAPNKAIPAFTSPLVQLLPNYDEFLGSYKDHVPSMRPDIVLKPDRRSVVFANHIIVLDGTVVGGWRRELKKNEVLIEATLLKRLTAAERHALESAAADYGHFLQLNPKMEIAYE